MSRPLVQSSILEAAPLRVRRALEAGELKAGDLTARHLAAFLGQTTSVLYHHWGSLDGFLFAVSMSGFDVLSDRLEQLASADRALSTVAEAYVEFALGNPALYALMLEHPFDWAALRASGALTRNQTQTMRGWNLIVALLERVGSAAPADDARLFQAGLHGIVSQALTGRLNVGDLSRSDHETAVRSARRLARVIQRSFTAT